MSSSIANVRWELPVPPFSLLNMEREHVGRDEATSQADRDS